MTKEQLEQFAKKYEKPKVGPGREAKEVEVKVGEQPAAKPGQDMPGAGVQSFTTDKIRQRGGIPQDTARGNVEGGRDTPPPEFRDRVAGYHSRLGRIRRTTPRPAAPQKPAPAGDRK